MSALILEFFLEISLSYSVSYSCCCCFFLCPPTNLFKTIKTEEQFHDQWADNMFNCEVESVCTALYIHRWEQQTVEKPLTAGGCNNPHLYKHRWLLTISGLFWSRTAHLDEKTVWLTCKMTNPTFNVHLEVRKNKINDITTISVKSSKKLSSWIYRLLYKWLKHTECHSVVLTNGQIHMSIFSRCVQGILTSQVYFAKYRGWTLRFISNTQQNFAIWKYSCIN